MMAIRKVLRLPDVLSATGWSRSSLYAKVKEGRFPQSHRLDPRGAAVIWFEDEVEAWQKGEWNSDSRLLVEGTEEGR